MGHREAVVKMGDVVEGRYRIIKALGAGGMGTVFLAEHALIKRKVAIKILHADLATDANVVERFMNEARAAGTLGHPNIVESTDMGFTQALVPYIVYEYLEGTLLTDEVYRVGGLPVRRAVRIAEQIASALHAAHSASIVHRDLKSDNIFLTDKDDALDHVKVLDFGVARFLEVDDRQRNMIMGTPEFMAPEQITDPDSVDRRADVYALGIILYEMLTARRPFSYEDDPRALMHRICTEAPPPLMRDEIPHALEAIILGKMLAKAPADRYASMQDVSAALEQFLTRGDGTPLPRRSQRLSAEPANVPAAPMRQTPWPVDTLDGATPLAMGQVTLPPTSARKPWALYGVAGAGIVMGALGLAFGLHGGTEASANVAQVAPAAAPTASAPAAAPEPARPEKITVKLDASVPGARIVFRRRVADAPVSLEIHASDVVELVEVSAPGYKTTRYWLTFDRPTVLDAKLVRGTGNVEATEEETLVALGEVIMVKDTPAAVPAATVAAPRERTVQKVVSPVATPRKIGRAEPAVEAAEVARPEEPAPVAPSPQPKASEAPLPAVAPVATKEPTLVEPVRPAEVAKVEAPEPPRPAIDRATVSSVVTTHRPEVLKCFSEGKKKNAAMKGTLTLQLEVQPSGKVKRVQVQSTLGAPLVAACVVRAANAWTFPTRASSDVATVQYPFTIN